MNTDNLISVTWKVPARGDLRLSLNVRLPPNCKRLVEPVGRFQNGAYIERSNVQCIGGLKNKAVGIDGLRSSLTDALARVEYIDGTYESVRLTPEQPSFVLKGEQTTPEIAQTYLILGVGHILGGVDHLLFVFALILLVRDRWMLVKTITAFTAAHSVTLAGSALGYMSLPQWPVEAAIALSIAFVAAEIVKGAWGEAGQSHAAPWIIAFAFGLLHGFGFAGAIQEIGLPQKDIPLALLLFNLGVEAGQLMFVAVVLAAFFAANQVIQVRRTQTHLAAGYAIGIISTTWLITRLGAV